MLSSVYPKKYAHGFCFAVRCCGYILTDFPISIRLTSLALWQSNDCPSASKAALMNIDKYFMWIHYERLHNHNKAKHNKTGCIFLGIYCIIRLEVAYIPTTIQTTITTSLPVMQLCRHAHFVDLGDDIIWGLCCQEGISQAGLSYWLKWTLWDAISNPYLRHLLLASKYSIIV